MSILSDKELVGLCMAPKHRVDVDGYHTQMSKEGYLPPDELLLELNTVPKFEAWITEHKEQVIRDNLIDLTPEEIADFVPMIEPFSNFQIREVFNSITKPMGSPPSMVEIPTNPRKIISMGLSSYGYDVSLATEFKLFTNINSTIIDPKRLDERCLVDAEIKTDEDGALYVIMPPNSYLLGRTREYFRIPRNIMVIALGKSTYARAGAIVNVTPIEPGFEGNVVIEVSNNTNLPLKIYANEGISQFLFFEGDQPCHTSYGDRKGKYQGQLGIKLPTV